MDQVRKINQAYSQKPWRKQIQRLVVFLAALVIFGLIAGLNLSVNARAATIGRQVQYARKDIERLENEIIDQYALLGELSSSSVMEQRALEIGFRPAKSDEILYLVVEGYNGRNTAMLASENTSFVQSSSPQLSPEYTQTLLEWVADHFSIPAGMIGKNDQ